MKFEYKREDCNVEAYGNVYPIPTKTAVLVDGVTEINKAIGECKSTLEIIRTTKKGIAIFIGDAETERIFPAANENKIDTDELSAFWFALNNESNRATRAVIDAYAPERQIRKVK